MPGSSEVDLRAFAFLDSMQPQFASFIATVARGYLPVAGQAALFTEIAPGIAINQITDVALKATAVRPGMQIVERAFGMLEIHSESQAEVREAGDQILRFLGVTEMDRHRPRVHSHQIITGIDDHQAMLLNRERHGNMILGGETLYIMEVEPAASIVLAANEAEKAASVKLLELRAFGAFGRLYLGGGEAEIEQAAAAAEKAVQSVQGRDPGARR
jgi:ethanolamine utilization microcompartment shell protein EutS